MTPKLIGITRSDADAPVSYSVILGESIPYHVFPRRLVWKTLCNQPGFPQQWPDQVVALNFEALVLVSLAEDDGTSAPAVCVVRLD